MQNLLYAFLAVLVGLLGYWLGIGFFGKKEPESTPEVVSDCGCGGGCGCNAEGTVRTYCDHAGCGCDCECCKDEREE